MRSAESFWRRVDEMDFVVFCPPPPDPETSLHDYRKTGWELGYFSFWLLDPPLLGGINQSAAVVPHLIPTFYIIPHFEEQRSSICALIRTLIANCALLSAADCSPNLSIIINRDELITNARLGSTISYPVPTSLIALKSPIGSITLGPLPTTVSAPNPAESATGTVWGNSWWKDEPVSVILD